MSGWLSGIRWLPISALDYKRKSLDKISGNGRMGLLFKAQDGEDG
jgi:hypothetical protein